MRVEGGGGKGGGGGVEKLILKIKVLDCCQDGIKEVPKIVYLEIHVLVCIRDIKR